MEANRRSEITGLSGADRAQDQGSSRRRRTSRSPCSNRARPPNGSDFYTYRYLATEGFLPGYNFPRLPLYAFVPARGEGRLVPAARALPRHLRVRPAQPDLSRGPRLPGQQGQAAAGSPDRRWRRTRDRRHLSSATNCGAAHDRRARALPRLRRADGRRCIRSANAAAHRQRRDRAGRAHHRQRRGRVSGRASRSRPCSPGRGATAGSMSPRRMAGDDDGPILSLCLRQRRRASAAQQGAAARKEKSIFGFGIDPAHRPLDRSQTTKDDDDDPAGQPAKPARRADRPGPQERACCCASASRGLAPETHRDAAARARARPRGRLPARGRRDPDRAVAGARQPPRHSGLSRRPRAAPACLAA